MCVCVCVCIPPFNPVYKHPPNLFLIRLNRGQTSLANIDIGWVSNVQHRTGTSSYCLESPWLSDIVNRLDIVYLFTLGKKNLMTACIELVLWP